MHRSLLLKLVVFNKCALIENNNKFFEKIQVTTKTNENYVQSHKRLPNVSAVFACVLHLSDKGTEVVAQHFPVDQYRVPRECVEFWPWKCQPTEQHALGLRSLVLLSAFAVVDFTVTAACKIITSNCNHTLCAFFPSH